jgi:histidinol-phosphate aminotransferase
MHRGRADVRDEVAALGRAAAGTRDPVIVVAEQAGAGPLPADALSRAWLDALGAATQALSAVAVRALVVVAGRALELPPPPVGAAPAGMEDLRHHGDTLVRPGDTDHAVNVLAGGPPAWLRTALRRALEEDVAAYPREAETVAALAALHGRAPEEIVPCNGAAQALWLLPAALRPRLAVCVHPGFTETEAALRAHGVPVARVLRDAERGFALDPAAVPEAADLVVVGNPASPSGTLDPQGALLALRRPGRTVVVDEAFMDLVPGEPSSLVREPLPDMIVTRSLTKSLAIPGLRAGYAVAPAPLAERLRAVRPPWSCNALALAALLATAQRPEALEAAAARAQAERADLEQRLADVPGLRTWPAAANYVLVRVRDGPAVTARLRDAGIAVRPAGSFPGLTAGDLRITARGPRDNARLAGLLAEAVAG